MKGIFHDGPTMEPLFQIYLTDVYVSIILWNAIAARLTLIIGDEYGEDGEGQTKAIHAIV